MRTGENPNPRSLRNFPMQGNGSELLRLACCLATERGIHVCAPVHDALLIEGPADAIHELVAETQHAMREASEIVPQLDASKFVAASWNPDDGVVFPWPFLWGYADGARRRGAQVETFTRATGIEVSEGRVRAVQTDRGRVAADRVVVAAGAWSPTVARLAGVQLPNVPYRHEIVSSEPLKPFLGPLVTMLGTGLYFSQSMRGEIVGGMGDPKEDPGLNQTSSLRFLARYGRALADLMPQLVAVKLLRQWAGCYDVTPDHSPVLGETPGVAGLLQMSGFVGHGFMMAPAVARRMAEWMGGAPDEIFERYNVRRFAEGRLIQETFIIG